MKLVDANVLLYAVDEAAEHHRSAHGWLARALGGTETIVLPWVSVLAFLRIATNTRIYASPLSTDGAAAIVDAWISRPNVLLGSPGPDHWRLLRRLIADTGTGGNLVTDAHLAALALESGATVVTFDNDFARFPGVRWQRPSDR